MSEQTEPTPTITKQQIDAWKRQRAEQFNVRLTALCNELECDLVAIPQLSDGRIVASIVVQPR